MTGTLQIVPNGTGDIYRVRARYDVHRCAAKMDLGFALRIGTSDRAPRVQLEVRTFRYCVPSVGPTSGNTQVIRKL